MTEETVQDTSAQNSEQEQEFVKFIAIGFRQDGKLDIVTSQGNASTTILDLLAFQRYFNDRINSMILGDNSQVIGAISKLSDSVMHLIGKVDVLETQINNLKK